MGLELEPQCFSSVDLAQFNDGAETTSAGRAFQLFITLAEDMGVSLGVVMNSKFEEFVAIAPGTLLLRPLEEVGRVQKHVQL